MSKRKELILKAIYAHTLECLEDKQYDKLGMDASSLAMDLRLDRSIPLRLTCCRNHSLIQQRCSANRWHVC